MRNHDGFLIDSFQFLIGRSHFSFLISHFTTMYTTLLSRRGYTLLEILIAVTLMMMIMLGLTQLFSSVGTQINNTQATLQLAGNLRSVKSRLENDLKLVTVDLTKAPPLKTGLNQGYFCIIEGMGAAHNNALLLARDAASQSITVQDIAYTSDSTDLPYDNTVGDMDDVLMFTAYAPQGQPFRGLVGGHVHESYTAEVIWFFRGNTLYRRTLLILPDLDFQSILGTPEQGFGFYQRNDVSVRINPDTGFLAANTLEDLSLRQNRFGHAFSGDIQQAFPFNIHKNSAAYYMRMPTIQETSLPDWNVSQSFVKNLESYIQQDSGTLFLTHTDGTSSESLPDSAGNKPFIDFWENPFPWSSGTAWEFDPVTGSLKDSATPRFSEDVILTNVLSFDIQVWDDVAGRYVSMGEAPNGTYADGRSAGPLGRQGNYPLRAGGTLNPVALPCVYDTWSEEYEREGYAWPDQTGNTVPTRGRDQIDNDGSGVIDDIGEWTTPPPYDVPLRGVKITIRTFDPLGKSVRDMTIVHSFK